MVTEILQRTPYWTAVRCRVLFWQEGDGGIVLDAVLSATQPDCYDWDLRGGSPIALTVAVPSQPLVATARSVIGRWAETGDEIEIRRTRAWETASQVLLCGPGASLLVSLAG